MIDGLKPYPAMKDSQVEWLGQVPEHWGIERLKSLSSNVVEKSSGSGPVGRSIALEDVESWTGRFRSRDREVAHDDPWKHFAGGDVLFGKLRPYLAKVCRPQLSGRCVSEFLVLRPRGSDVASGFLERLLRSKPVIDVVDSATFGAKMPRAEWAFIGSLRVVRPPRSEQSAIVRFLDHVDQRIQRYIRAKEKMIALLEEQKQAIIHQAVTGQIDVRTGQPYPAYKDSGMEWLGQVPEHWQMPRVRSVCRVRYGLGQPPRESANGLPLIRATNVSRGKILEKDLLYVDPAEIPPGREAELNAGEIIVVRSGAYTADSAIIPKSYAGSIAGYDMVLTAVDALPEFVAAALLSSYLRDDQLIVESTRSAQPHLNAEELGSATLLLPPLAEQRAIADHLDRAVTLNQSVTEAVTRQIALLSEHRVRLIADVVTGKFDVRDCSYASSESDTLTIALDKNDQLDLRAQVETEEDAGIVHVEAVV